MSEPESDSDEHYNCTRRNQELLEHTGIFTFISPCTKTPNKIMSAFFFSQNMNKHVIKSGKVVQGLSKYKKKIKSCDQFSFPSRQPSVSNYNELLTYSPSIRLEKSHFLKKVFLWSKVMVFSEQKKTTDYLIF